MSDVTPLPDSPSALSVALGECPAALHDYLRRRRSKAAQLPSKPRDDGTIFHRIVEVLQRASKEGADVEETLEVALNDLCASVDVEERVEAWLQGGHLDMGMVAGFELAFGLTHDWRICGFNDPSRAGRCVIDRAEIREDSEGRRYAKVVDWKSGFTGWTKTQPEYYAVAMDAWLEAHHDGQYGPDVEYIECVIWTPALEIYRDRRRYLRSEGAGLPTGDEPTTEDCRRYIARARRYFARLMLRPAEEERPGERCGYCDRRGVCASYAALSASSGALSVETPEDAARLLGEWVGAKRRVAELERVLKAHCRTQGDIEASDGSVIGWRGVEGEKVHMDLVFTSLLASVRDRLEEAFVGEGRVAADAYAEVIETLAKRLPVGKMSLKRLAVALCRGDKEAQGELMDQWIGRGETKERWGVVSQAGVVSDD